MVIRKLFGRKGGDIDRGRQAIVVDRKAQWSKNPLPKLIPSLYDDEPEDGFKEKARIMEDAEEVVRDLLYDCHLPIEKLSGVILNNISLIVDIPEIYKLMVALSRKEMKRFYLNNFAMATITQAAAFYGNSELSEVMRENMLLSLLGVFSRYYGMIFLKKDERAIFEQDYMYDVTNARQMDLRKQFIKQYRKAADKLAHTSVDRLSVLLGEKHQLSDGQMRGLFHVVRYSTRLMGRAAEEMSASKQENIHVISSYVAVMFSFASAWLANRKKVAVILAEEWSRHKVYCSKKDFQSTSLYNSHALSDLFRVCRCVVLTNFQGNHKEAIYSRAENIIVKEKEAFVELKPGSKHSIRRFIKGKPGCKEDTDENEIIGETKVQMRWQAYRPHNPVKYRARSLNESLSEKRMGNTDPSNDELDEI